MDLHGSDASDLDSMEVSKASANPIGTRRNNCLVKGGVTMRQILPNYVTLGYLVLVSAIITITSLGVIAS